MILLKLKKIFSSQLRLNMLSGSVATGLGFIAAAVKFPLYLHFLGYEQYGVWLLLSIILAFAQMGLLGVDTAIIKLVAEEYEQKNHTAIQEYFMTALCMLTVISLVSITICMLFKTRIISSMGLEGENAELADGLFVYMIIFSIGVLAYQILNSVLAGTGRIDLANYSQTALQLIPIPISIPLLLAGQGVVSLLLANAISYSAIFLLNLNSVNRIVTINPLDIMSCSLQRFKRMIRFGSTLFAGYLLQMLVLPITRIVITKSIGVGELPVFELSYRVSKKVRSVFEVAFRALMPEISNLSSSGCRESVARINSIISKSYRLLFLGATPLYLLVALFAGTVFKVWLGASYAPSIPNVFRVLLLVTFVSLMGVIPYYLNIGYGKVNKILIHHILCAGGTLFSIGVTVNFVPNIHIITIAWCFLPGAILGTGYLLLTSQKNHKTNLSRLEI